MREIKFRGKSLKDGKWVYGYYVLRPFQTHCIYGSDFVEEIAPDTLGQYIGLKDKDGREIYEGDIVHYRAATEDSFPNPTAEYDGVVYYDECGELCFGNFLAAYCSSVLVLGNIYENPELLGFLVISMRIQNCWTSQIVMTKSVKKKRKPRQK